MDIVEKKELLIHLVQDADDKLVGLLTALAREYNNSEEKYTAEEIEDFYQVKDQMLKEPETTYLITKENYNNAHSDMNNLERKETLINIIDGADERLTRLLIAVAHEYNSEERYSAEELNLFNERKEAFFANNKQGSSVEDAHNRIRRKFANGV